jgi:hypothetical protein
LAGISDRYVKTWITIAKSIETKPLTLAFLKKWIQTCIPRPFSQKTLDMAVFRNLSDMDTQLVFEKMRADAVTYTHDMLKKVISAALSIMSKSLDDLSKSYGAEEKFPKFKNFILKTKFYLVKTSEDMETEWENFEPALVVSSSSDDFLPLDLILPETTTPSSEKKSQDSEKKKEGEDSTSKSEGEKSSNKENESEEESEPVDVKAELKAFRRTLRMRPLKGKYINWGAHFKTTDWIFKTQKEKVDKIFANWCDRMAQQSISHFTPLIFLYYLDPGILFFFEKNGSCC